jgi:Tetratricopeptide repeat
MPGAGVRPPRTSAPSRHSRATSRDVRANPGVLRSAHVRMAPALPPTVEKYQRILLADPRSRIFVELARALLESGEPAQALAVCEGGLSHHPDSIQARVLAARALLALGRGATSRRPAHPAAARRGDLGLRGERLDRANLESGADPHPLSPTLSPGGGEGERDPDPDLDLDRE